MNPATPCQTSRGIAAVTMAAPLAIPALARGAIALVSAICHLARRDATLRSASTSPGPHDHRPRTGCPNGRAVALAAAALLLVSFRSLAEAAALESINVEPPIVHMRPCEVMLLEITGHYDDGTARDLELEFGLTFTFAEGIAQRSGTRTVVNNVGLDDVLTVSLDGIDSAPVPLIVITPEDRSRCVGGGTTTTTSPPPTTSSSTTTSTTTTTTTLDPSTPPTPSTSTTTTTTLPQPEDAACGSCVHDRIQHWFRIENHVIFGRERLLQDRCAAVEFPRPIFQVAADGTQSSVFDVTRVVEGSCQTTLTDPNPRFLDDSFQPIANPDPDLHGVVFAIDRRPDFVSFNYTHPTTPPAPGAKFRVIRIGIFYTDRQNPGGPERLGTIVEIRVYRTPVLMIHGLWSDASAFAAMDQTLAASNYEPFQLFRLDYASTNDSSFSANTPLVRGGILAAIKDAVDAGFAAGKVDLVTHSMGGIIARLYMQGPNYGHEVRRLITSNGPHAGSQMANLLLDRTFDRNGRLCNLLSVAMSSPSAPNRSCQNGAVDDLQVSSRATTNDLNLGTHPTDVAVHAVATVFDLADLPDLTNLAGAFGSAPLVIAKALRLCSLSLVDSIFNFDDSDFIVSATSQGGGLPSSFTSLYPNQPHMAVDPLIPGLFPRIPGPVENPAVIDRVKQLLDEPDNSGSLTHAGFSPGQLGYTTPSLCPIFLRARTLGASRSAVATELTITSPAPDTIVTPGESFGVEVAGSPDIATILLVMSQPGDGMVLAEQPGPDAHFDLQVPDTAIGEQNLVAAGFDASGALVAVSDVVHVDVTVPSALDSITVYPPVVNLQPCTTASLEITGHYADGIARDLSAQPDLGLTFAIGNAAQSGVTEVVLDEPLDDTLIVTFDGVDSALVPIRALVPDGFVSCDAGTTTTTTLETSTTTSTTTTPTSSTTTSTLPPVCQADADCDDGDACTGDVCTPGGCEHVAAAGPEGADCLLSAALSEPLCPAGTIDPKLEEFATRKLERALELVREAAQSTKPKRQQRLLDKASKALRKIERHKPGATTDDCLQLLTARIDDILDTL